MGMEQMHRIGGGARNVTVTLDGGMALLHSFFGMAGVTHFDDVPIPQCLGLFSLDSDLGRVEGEKWHIQSVRQTGDGLELVQTGSCFRLEIHLTCHRETGVIRWRTWLENQDTAPHILYTCMPRIPLQGSGYEIYGQYSGWCAENQGGWNTLQAGEMVLSNSGGRSTESCTPFACIRHGVTGAAAAIHVVPVGDWMLRFRRVAGHRTSYTVLEAGLSDASLRMEVAPGERLELPELVMYGFDGILEHCGEPLQRYLLSRYPDRQLPEPIYNTWFYDFDVLEAEKLRAQADIARGLGCRTFVVDAGWFGQGVDWESQVGCWEECTARAFCGRMAEFADYVRSLGMDFGLWMEPERACRTTEVYQNHPQWFLKADAVLYNLSDPEVVAYLADQVTRVIETYGVRWLKLDYNTNMLRDLTGSNFYRYYRGEQQLMEEIRRRNPQCSLEGCASGGLRTDFHGVMAYYHGHFASDTVNPLEILRIRQNAAPRLLPAYLGSWLVAQEVPFPASTYTDHRREARRKVLTCGDAWWEQALDVPLEFALHVNLLGEWGLSGDLTSLSPASLETIRNAVAFHNCHRPFMARTVCHPLTALAPMDDLHGWAALQYENTDGLGSVIFAFRLIDDADTLFVYPRNLIPHRRYRLIRFGEELGLVTGEELTDNGIAIHCPQRYASAVLELIPAPDAET